MRHKQRKKRKAYGGWRCSPENYQDIKRKLHALQKKFAWYGKAAQRDHFDLLERYTVLRYHPLVQFLMFIRFIPREKA